MSDFEESIRTAIGKAYFDNLRMRKEAGETAKQLGGRAIDFLGRHGPELAGGALGAALITGLGAYRNRPGKDGLSPEQKQTRESATRAEFQEAADKKLGKKPSYSSELSRIFAKTNPELADAGAKHPFKAGLRLAPYGALAGHGVTFIIQRAARAAS
jgi:hypothetical protein